MMTRILLVIALSSVGAGQTIEQPSRSVTDPGIVTTRQAITPAGVPSVFQGLPLSCIGEVTRKPGVVLVGPEGREEKVATRGWDPF